jgi:hypothetical protein
MKIQVVSYIEKIDWEIQDNLNTKLFNESTADIILFPGWSFKDTNQLENFNASISNKKTLGIFELQRLDSRNLTNGLFAVEKGVLRFISFQLFSTSNEIANNPFLGSIFLKDFRDVKSFLINRKCIRIMQCGELNILKNEQAKGNKVGFRFKDKNMNENFLSTLASTDIILNPQHSPMGNQGKMLQRRKYLSSKGKAYFSTSNVSNSSALINSKAGHYAYFNGKPLESLHTTYDDSYALYEYNIK